MGYIALYSRVFIRITFPYALIRFYFLNFSGILDSTFLFCLLKHIISRKHIVFIGQLRKIFNLPTWHLHHTKVKRIINSIAKPLSIFILQMFLSDLKKQINPSCLQMTVIVMNKAVSIILFDIFLIGLGCSNKKLCISDWPEVVWVYWKRFSLMIKCVEKLKNIFSYHFIISINYHQNFSLLAKRVNWVIYICHMTHSFLIFLQYKSLFFVDLR